LEGIGRFSVPAVDFRVGLRFDRVRAAVPVEHAVDENATTRGAESAIEFPSLQSRPGIRLSAG